jgi:hypothetical protein
MSPADPLSKRRSLTLAERVKRRAEMLALREKDPQRWTLEALGAHYGVDGIALSPQRVHRILAHEPRATGRPGRAGKHIGAGDHEFTGPYCDCRIHDATEERDCCCVGGIVCWDNPIMWCVCGAFREVT